MRDTTTKSEGNTLQVADLREGMLVHTQAGKSAIRSRWTTSRNGKERIGISLANGLVYASLRPYDKVKVG